MGAAALAAFAIAFPSLRPKVSVKRNPRWIIVCVDESLSRDRSAFCARAVLFYRRRVDAQALLAAAERVATEAT